MLLQTDMSTNQTIKHSNGFAIKQTLHESLKNLGNFEQCALLQYPRHINIGDHLIWLGTVFYLTNVLKTKITYASSLENFSQAEMDEKIGDFPIILHGGGNFGDIWYKDQKFREYVISQNHHRQIIVMPQTIYFQNKSYLEKSAKVFNSHPNLTLCVRDRYSYDFAIKYFDNCRIILAPDMAFQMAGMPCFSVPRNPENSILYLNRTDKELNQGFLAELMKIPNLVVADWISYEQKWILGNANSRLRQIFAQLYREVWQRGLATPQEFIDRRIWLKTATENIDFNSVDNPSMHRLSLSFLHSGIYQLQKYRLIITNRLHGHILCVLLNIPHIFLPNSYHKNQSFYETWSYDIPFCRFVSDITQIEANVQELLVSERLKK
ncbi:polysaccharide pyruvyl transferase family protein [Dapis sp. BLCC M229]|uniref:polysaccharide pyruvyl transferase family protein n=1 Tax=Dapis sp. BLCC M229 TaxID=3400188 RepID=UPI003CFAF77C